MAMNAGTAVAFLKLDAGGFTGGLNAARASLRAFDAQAQGVRLGREMVNGIIAGAASRRGALTAQMRALARAAIAAARSELQISSPSKVFLGIGANVADAFAQGVQSGQRAAMDSVARLVAPGGVQSAAQSAPVVRAAPVVNLTLNAAQMDARELSRTLGSYIQAMNYGR